MTICVLTYAADIRKSPPKFNPFRATLFCWPHCRDHVPAGLRSAYSMPSNYRRWNHFLFSCSKLTFLLLCCYNSSCRFHFFFPENNQTKASPFRLKRFVSELIVLLISDFVFVIPYCTSRTKFIIICWFFFWFFIHFFRCVVSQTLPLDRIN